MQKCLDSKLTFIYMYMYISTYVCMLYILYVYALYIWTCTYLQYIRTVCVLLLKVKLAGRVTTFLLARPELLVYCGNDNLIR